MSLEFLAGLLVGLAAGAIAVRVFALGAERERAERELLEGWVRHNLRAIRAKVAYAFPEAESVCNSLETALPARCVVDLEGLERHLMALRRAHNAALLDAAGHERDKYRDGLKQLLALLKLPTSGWTGPWEELEGFEAILGRKGGAE